MACSLLKCRTLIFSPYFTVGQTISIRYYCKCSSVIFLHVVLWEHELIRSIQMTDNLSSSFLLKVQTQSMTPVQVMLEMIIQMALADRHYWKRRGRSPQTQHCKSRRRSHIILHQLAQHHQTFLLLGCILHPWTQFMCRLLIPDLLELLVLLNEKLV